MSSGLTFSRVGDAMRSSTIFPWESITPLETPVVPEVNSSMFITSLSITASRKSLFPSFRSSWPDSISLPYDKKGSSWSEASMLTRNSSFVFLLALMSAKIDLNFLLHITHWTSPSITSCSSSPAGSSLSSGTTIPVPQVTAR